METDEEIYIRYMTTDDDADLEALLIRHREGLLLFLLGFVRNAEDAEELMMDTFAKLAVDKPNFEPDHPGSFKGWLYTIARRNALMHIRKKRYETVPLDESIPSDAELPDTVQFCRIAFTHSAHVVILSGTRDSLSACPDLYRKYPRFYCRE